jgi:GNAT superfamily N-acetyltransferase
MFAFLHAVATLQQRTSQQQQNPADCYNAQRGFVAIAPTTCTGVPHKERVLAPPAGPECVLQANNREGNVLNERSFTIRLAQRADVAAIHALIRELATYERLADACVSTAEQIDLALFGPRPCAEVLIAYETVYSDGAAGFALFFHTFSTFLGRRGLWLEDLFVRPDCRRQGLGRRLLAQLAQIARERDCGRFEWSVLDWNTPAIRFYERLGAVLMQDWRIARVTGDALDALAAGPANGATPAR